MHPINTKWKRVIVTADEKKVLLLFNYNITLKFIQVFNSYVKHDKTFSWFLAEKSRAPNVLDRGSFDELKSGYEKKLIKILNKLINRGLVHKKNDNYTLIAYFRTPYNNLIKYK